VRRASAAVAALVGAFLVRFPKVRINMMWVWAWRMWAASPLACWPPSPFVKVASNRKGCDIGYGLAANSCEGVNSVDTCTVTALDAITAFTVPNPGGILAEQSVFSGLVVRRVAPMNGSLSLLQISDVLRSQPFSTVDIRDTSR